MTFSIGYVVNAVAAGYLLCFGIHSMNLMGKNTRWQIVVAYLLLTVGAFAMLAAPFFGQAEPTWVQIASHWGIAFLMFADKRRCHWDCTPEKRRMVQN